MAGRRRTKGDGGLWQRKDGMWVGSIEAGWDENGDRQRKYVSAKSQAVALEKLRIARAAMDRHGSVPTKTTTVEAWLTLWIETVAQVKPSTRGSYRSTIRTYLVPKLGRHRLEKLAPTHIRVMLAWIQGPEPSGLGLSASTAHRAHRVLRKALSDAVSEGLLTASPVAAVKAPSLAGIEQDFLTVDQVRTFLAATFEDWWGPRWATAFLTGERQGEVLGMEWSRVNLAARTIDVSWQLQRVQYRHGCGGTCHVKRPGSCPEAELDVPPWFQVRRLDGGLCLTRPKTASGTRLVPISDALVAYLHRQAQQSRGLPNPHGLVFHREDGRPVDPSQDSAAWHAALKAAGLPPVKHHVARHTAATLMLIAGADAKVVQSVMGHSTVTMTRAYQHVDQTLSATAMAAMAGLLGQVPAALASGGGEQVPALGNA